MNMNASGTHETSKNDNENDTRYDERRLTDDDFWSQLLWSTVKSIVQRTTMNNSKSHRSSFSPTKNGEKKKIKQNQLVAIRRNVSDVRVISMINCCSRFNEIPFDSDSTKWNTKTKENGEEIGSFDDLASCIFQSTRHTSWRAIK